MISGTTVKIQGSVFDEQGIRFAVIIVKRYILEDAAEAQKAIRHFGALFDIPIVLMAQNTTGRPIFRGRPDLVQFMSMLPLERIVWREYSIEL